MSLTPTAKVNLITSKGNIEIGLFAAQIPNLCKTFIYNCINKKYNGCSFGKITTDLAQVHGSFESTPIVRESHSRLKFDGKGDVGLLSIDDSNKATASGFFITTQPCPQFNSKYTIIGKITSDSMYNVMEIADCEKMEDGESPMFPVHITDALVPLPYFDDILVESKSEQSTKPQVKKQKKTLRLDFDEEEDGDDLQNSDFKIKSAHEIKKNKSSKDQTARTGDNVVSTEDKDEIEQLKPTNLDSDAELPAKANIGEKKEDFGVLIEKEAHEKPEGEELEEQQVKDTKDESRNSDLVLPDPSIDPYDSNLDISKDEVTFDQLQNHYFKCR